VETASKGGIDNSIPATGFDLVAATGCDSVADASGAIDQDNASINGTEGDASEDAGTEDAGDSLGGAP
jgi:hypothetical protein